ncbi:hypothetical protein BU26DRAFT_566448 [Trematosphaeria pertusa]|uniref:Uncharacterized protein n=1 Tax=Trematosphaeria pertusa TaxID=390896 RepID=A0A6A6IC39_9PLEO|nr:uncharacterized protein BU26DRAFT_566448 [Trematosphaeria pertusa]KAF2247472.1 hypothetical protein BU26DRAFT_566448 [Trematosphaeria pertusa]
MLSEPTLRQPRQLSTSADRAHPTYGRGNGSRNNSIDDDHVASSRRYIRGRVHVQAHDPTGIRLSPLFVSYARNIGAGTPTIVSASWKQRYTAISCVPDGVEEAFGVTPQQDLNQEKLPPRHACRPLGRQLGSPPRRQAFSVELKLTVFAEASAIPCAPREEKRRPSVLLGLLSTAVASSMFAGGTCSTVFAPAMYLSGRASGLETTRFWAESVVPLQPPKDGIGVLLEICLFPGSLHEC